MNNMKYRFKLGNMGLFGAVDVGKDACWWDYGQLKKYALNNQKLLSNDPESLLMMKFFNITSRQMNSTVKNVQMDQYSCIFSSKLSSCSITKSLLANVQASHVQASNSIIVNCTAKNIVAPNRCILYNVADDSQEGIILTKEGEVLVSVVDESGNTMLLRSNLDICGGKAWKTILDGNTLSFEDVHSLNINVDVVKIEAKRKI